MDAASVRRNIMKAAANGKGKKWPFAASLDWF
jgi:hypothetical protein